MAKLVSHENNKAVFTAVLPYEEFKSNLNEAYKQTKSRYNVPGFRKGKAPRTVIENNYGKDVFWNDALDLSLGKMYEDALEELNLEPVSKPKVDVLEEIEEGKDIEVTFEVETFPQVELADYSNIEIEKMDDHINEELVDAKISEELDKNKVLKPVERPIQEGDLVNIDFEGFKDGQAFEGGKAEGYDLKIGSQSFIPGFEEGLVGKEKGQDVEVNVTFPEQYQAEELAGQDATFKVKINEVTEEILPELDDEFVMDVSEFDTLDEYKESVRQGLRETQERNNRIELENKVLEEVLRRTEFAVPTQMVEDQLDDEYHDYEHQMSHMGLDMNTYFQITGSNEEQVREQLRQKASDKVRVQVILDKLVEENDYEVSEADIDAEYDDVLKEYNKEGDEEFKNMLKGQVDENQVKNVIKRRKALEDLISNVVYVDKKEEEVEVEETPEDTQE